MRITVSFEAENDAFCEDFEGEVTKVMQQATDFLVGNNDNELLFDTNGNKVGFVYRSTIIRPRRRTYEKSHRD